MKTKPIISGLKALTPTRITDPKTGEVLDWESVLVMRIQPLLDYCYTETVNLYEGNKAQILVDCASSPKISPAEYGRIKGYTPDLTNLPREVKAKSRVERLIRFKLISETSSYTNNPNPNKAEHKFNRSINLGSVDAQMATLTRAEDRLSLTWKVWDRELIFDFIIPPFILKRDVVKWSLPTVSANGFNYSYQETPATNAGYNTAGVDLGRAVLFTMAVTGTNNTYVKHVPSPRLASLNLKRERLLKEKKSTLTKLNAYKTLNMETVILGLQVKRLTGKARQIGVELTAKSAREITNLALKNKVKILHIENLKWATGSKYGSKWNHGAQQEALTHQLTRTGIRVKTVNPRNTSQMCHKCGEKVTHNTRTRVATCPSCKQKLDRDFNAAVNILKDVNFKLSQPVSNMRTNGGNPTITEVTGNLNPKPILPNTSKR